MPAAMTIDVPKGVKGVIPPGVGRPKGGTNKITLGVKTALRDAFEALGGVEGLVTWGKENRGDFYKLWVKLLPPQQKPDDQGGLTIQIMQFGKFHDLRTITSAPEVQEPVTLISGEDEESVARQNAEAAASTPED
jgi:hypothetical protein